MLRHFAQNLMFVAPLFVLCGCGGSAPAPAHTEKAIQTPTPETAPAAPWSDDWTMEQKATFMKVNVAPALAKTFQAFDAKHFENFSCKSCHGPKGQPTREFLPKLTLKGGKFTSFETEPEMTQFMIEKVVPDMAHALGVPVFDPATKQGFGCGGCHQVDVQ